MRRFAAYFDLESGASRSLYTTPDTIAPTLAVVQGKKPRISKTKKE